MDIARTEIMKNRFAAMTEEAATVAFRTAHTTFIKQTQDFSVALASPSGESFAMPLYTGSATGTERTLAPFLQHYSDIAPGDLLITNDPFHSGGLVTHQMDIYLALPLFYGKDLVAFAWCFIHCTDIGGAVPGSVSPDLHECHQEGFRIRPTKLIRGGVMNDDLRNFLQDNSRIGDALWGDLEAMMAGLRVLELRMNDLCERVGVVALRQGINDVMDYAEAKARSVIAKLRDGEYEFSDYLEGSGTKDPVHIHCRLRIAGDEAEIDYTGSDPQVQAASNFITGGMRAHSSLCLGLTNYIYSIEPSTPVNSGVLRPMRSHAPSGTVMNAEYPAAMGNRWMTVMRCYDALMGCLNQAVDGGIIASGAGQAGNIAVSWQEHSGRTRVEVVEPFSGGSGGRYRADGVDATDTLVNYLKSSPVEYVEAETPLVIRQHALVPSSFGHGRYRGGASVCIEVECQAAQAKIMVRGLDRFRFQPWGVQGGHPGRSGETWLLRGGEKTTFGRGGVLSMQRGDRILMVSPSGGGFGDPTTRPAALVVEDVTNGLLDEAEAAEVYGVIVKSGILDTPATTRRREKMAATHTSVPTVTHGHGRGEYEEVWPTEASVAFANAVLRAPAGLRTAVQCDARAALAARRAPLSASVVSDTVADLVRGIQAPHA
ncbi:hydantoinase B/oxoprolinase family protein [Bradyrhizobium sp. 17]|uniref:hydantoinase B/oxoprolinase family protein n=1 Tax=Bradyrhizobium sp. 17 TaxID=2782649 RepID=UPI001FF91FBD|nr:hydantoinase B/oxoprolinase family protein [Bradyrhizobium sp. 17]MCK1524996.1 hydantoinase B/oxoprolinase family protein [Bradyrhizobium sp. 17]